MAARVFAFNMTDEARPSVRAQCMRKGVGYVEVPQADFGLTIQEIMNGRHGVQTEAPFSESFLLLSNLSQDQFNDVLDGMRGVYTGLKAIVTPTNRRWTPEKLLREIQAEHAAMREAAAKKQG